MCFRIGEFLVSSLCPRYMRCSTSILAGSLPKIILGICHWGHLSPVSSDILFCNFVSTSVIVVNFQIVTSGVTTALVATPHHHTPPITGPLKHHQHHRVHLTSHFIINPHFSEFIKTMKPAATPLPRRSTRNAKDAPSSVQCKAPLPSDQAPPTKINKKQQKAGSMQNTAPSP